MDSIVSRWLTERMRVRAAVWQVTLAKVLGSTRVSLGMLDCSAGSWSIKPSSATVNYEGERDGVMQPVFHGASTERRGNGKRLRPVLASLIFWQHRTTCNEVAELPTVQAYPSGKLLRERLKLTFFLRLSLRRLSRRVVRAIKDSLSFQPLFAARLRNWME